MMPVEYVSRKMVDVKLLNAGKSYKELPEYISIWILTDDPFGENRMIYTVKNIVEENPQIVYNDGVKKLFLYADGKYGGSEELRSLLIYFTSSIETNVVDNDIRQLHSIVNEIKNSREVGDKFMTLQEMIEYEKEESYKEGISEGISKGISDGIAALIHTCREFNISDEQIL